MEEAEIPTEQLHEHIEHAAHESNARWISGVALTSALLAVLAAITSLLSGKHANEAMLEQMKATDQWAYYQSKSIKATVLEAAGGRDRDKIERYRSEQEKIMEQAKELESDSAHHLELHEIFARGVTLFQVAIGVAAIAALTRRRAFWFVGMGFGLVGTVFLVQGLLH